MSFWAVVQGSQVEFFWVQGLGEDDRNMAGNNGNNTDNSSKEDHNTEEYYLFMLLRLTAQDRRLLEGIKLESGRLFTI